jgi:hypothetical protein
MCEYSLYIFVATIGTPQVLLRPNLISSPDWGHFGGGRTEVWG